MSKRIERSTVLPKINRKLGYSIISIGLLAIALLVHACGGSTFPATSEPSAQPSANQEVTISDLPRADIPLSKYLRFTRLTTEDGLSNDQVRGIVQDSHGFIWITTNDGLNRYNGSRVKIYKHDPDDPYSLSTNLVRVPIVDRNNVLWMGTYGGGLIQYDANIDGFINYQYDPEDPHSLSNNFIRAIYEDDEGTIWVGTNDGLNKLDRESKQFIRYMHDPEDPNSLGENVVLSILEDSSGEFWIGTADGLDRFDPNTEQFIHSSRDTEVTNLSLDAVRSIQEDKSGNLWFGTNQGFCEFDNERTGITCYQHDVSDPQSLSNNTVISVYVDQTDDIWVGTWGGGLNRFNRNTESFFRYEQHTNDQYSLSSNNITQIYGDNQGMLWLSTDGGVNMLDGGGKPFQHYRPIPDDPNSLLNNEVRSIYTDRTGVIWVGTNGGGLSKFDRRTEEFTHYQHDPDEPNSLSGDAVWAIYEDRMGQMWIGSYGMGLSKFNQDTGQFVHFQHDPNDPQSLSNNVVSAIHEDRNGNFWVGTENGLNKFDGYTFTNYHHNPEDPKSLASNDIMTIYEDHSGELWIGTVVGLHKFSPTEETFIRYQHDSNDPKSLSHDVVLTIYEDQAGTFWIGTANGLDKFDRKNEKFSHYTTKDGLSSETIFGILEDEWGVLWLSTAKGLTRFNPRNESYRIYDERDGLQSDTFLYYSAYSKSQKDEMFFGGTNGFNAFYPDQIVENLTPPPVVITDFQLANKPVPIGDESVLQKSILETDELVLSYLDNVFSFEFVALNYRAPEKNRYKYKVEGFEEEWNEVDSRRRFATYTNLDPGNYVFRVIASNNDGVWNEEGAAINITITPPWWETSWFRIGLGLLVVGLLVGAYRWRVSSIETRSREVEDQMRIIFESAQVGIALTNLEGDLLAANPALLSMLGYTEDEAKNLNVSSLYADPAERGLMLEQLDAENAVNDFGVKVKRKDGTVFSVSLNVSMTRRGEQDILLVVVEDVTEQISVEQASAVFIERERLARDLHDAVTQTLFSASVIAEATPKIWENDEQTGRRYLEQLPVMLRGALAEMRLLLLELMPSSIGEQTLGDLLEPLVDSARVYAQAEIDLTVESDHKLPDEVSLGMLRIVQEALNNTSKHSEARHITIWLNSDGQKAQIRIKDDGSGFDPNSIPAGSLGIGIMRERASSIGADLSIESAPGLGTTVMINWPAASPEGS